MMKRALNPSSMQKLTLPLPVTPPGPATSIARIYEVTVISAHRAVFVQNSNPASLMTAALGADGDQYCENLCTADVCPEANVRFGLGSVCEPTLIHGQCSDRACLDCTYDDAGHGCCAEALGPTWYCGGAGRCVDAGPCESEDCAVFLAKQAMPSAP